MTCKNKKKELDSQVYDCGAKKDHLRVNIFKIALPEVQFSTDNTLNQNQPTFNCDFDTNMVVGTNIPCTEVFDKLMADAEASVNGGHTSYLEMEEKCRDSE